MQKKQKILLTGGSGLLALNWAIQIREGFDVVLGTHQKDIVLPGVVSCRIHMETRREFSADLNRIRPDLVIHCAGLANVEVCEADPAFAHHVNVVLSENVANACKEQGIPLVYISTDHLFPGKKPLVTEEEMPDPVNVYGRTKWEGEQRILAVADQNLAIRTNFYGWGPSYRQSFSDMIIDSIRNGKEVRLFDDFFYTPILIEELALSVMELVAMGATGIFHVTGQERISKYQFGERLAQQFGLDTSLIKVSRFSDRHDLVQRPSDLSLSNKKLVSYLNRPVGDIGLNIARLFAQEQHGFSTLIRSV